MVQAALGALIGELMMGRRLGNWALAWGGLIGISLNLEHLVSPVLTTAGKLMWLGGISHSLGVMALFGYALTLGLTWLWRPQKIGKSTVMGFVAVVLVGHLLLDCLTVSGAGIFWPVSSNRLALGILDREDFLIGLPWLVAAVWIAFVKEEKPKKSRVKKPVPLTKRRRLALWGLGLGMLYLMLGIGMKAIASSGFEADLTRNEVKYERRMIGPMPYNPFFWRALVDRGDEVWVGYRSVFDTSSKPVRWTVYSRNKELLTPMAKLSELGTLQNFTAGWWIARPNAKGAWLGDLRFPESRAWEVRKTMVDHRLQRSWIIDANSDKEPLREIRIASAYDEAFVKRMGSRIFGDPTRWEGNPRLTGVKGSLPESLPVYEK